jgi:hypothetical protein
MGEVERCPDLCVGCSSAVKTFANLQVVRDEMHLAPTWMPPGGCTCSIAAVAPGCRRCFPASLVCQSCGATQPEHEGAEGKEGTDG